MKLTIGIKALNEEARIGAALASAVEAARPWDGEIILADSGSTDRTVEIARTFAVKIVRLANPSDKSCGAGAQLAFQHARGEYFYLLDGDMVLHAEFIKGAVMFLDSHPDVAGVGGFAREINTEGLEFQIRAASAREKSQPGMVDRLDGGGLYRASAIREAGYFADRNLHAFEEFELAARLRSAGWKLARIGLPSTDHFGHKEGYALLWRRLRSGYSGGAGEVLRSALGQRQWPIVLHDLNHVRYSAIVMLWWLLLVACCAAPVAASLRLEAVLILLLSPVAALCLRRKSLRLGLYSFMDWNVCALGLLPGFFRRRVSPKIPLPSAEL